MDEWVTQNEAARLLGVHVSLVPKMVRRGDLTPRRERPSLRRDQVDELAAARKAAVADQESRRTTPRPQAAATGRRARLGAGARSSRVAWVLGGGRACPRKSWPRAVEAVRGTTVVPAGPP